MGWWCFGMEKQKPAAGRDLPRLHGKNGEDGTIQGLFQLSQIPYVGCDTESSAICMDKAVTHTLLSAADIEQAHYLWFYADRFDAAPDTIKKKIKARLDFPVFVKPANAGSSVGVSKVERYEDLDEAIARLPERTKKSSWKRASAAKRWSAPCWATGTPKPLLWGRLAPLPSFTTMMTSMSTAPASCTFPPGWTRRWRRRSAGPLCGPTGCWAALA